MFKRTYLLFLRAQDNMTYSEIKSIVKLLQSEIIKKLIHFYEKIHIETFPSLIQRRAQPIIPHFFMLSLSAHF